MLAEIVRKNIVNITISGFFVVLSTLATAASREATHRTLTQAAQSVRKVKSEWRDRKLLEGE